MDSLRVLFCAIVSACAWVCLLACAYAFYLCVCVRASSVARHRLVGALGTEVKGLATSGASYLDKRTEFWRQQKPIYARVNEAKVNAQRNTMKGSAGWVPGSCLGRQSMHVYPPCIHLFQA